MKPPPARRTPDVKRAAERERRYPTTRLAAQACALLRELGAGHWPSSTVEEIGAAVEFAHAADWSHTWLRRDGWGSGEAVLAELTGSAAGHLFRARELLAERGHWGGAAEAAYAMARELGLLWGVDDLSLDFNALAVWLDLLLQRVPWGGAARRAPRRPPPWEIPFDPPPPFESVDAGTHRILVAGGVHIIPVSDHPSRVDTASAADVRTISVAVDRSVVLQRLFVAASAAPHYRIRGVSCGDSRRPLISRRWGGGPLIGGAYCGALPAEAAAPPDGLPLCGPRGAHVPMGGRVHLEIESRHDDAPDFEAWIVAKEVERSGRTGRTGSRDGVTNSKTWVGEPPAGWAIGGEIRTPRGTHRVVPLPPPDDGDE